MQKIEVVLWDVGGVIQQDDVQFPRMLGITPARYAELTKTEQFKSYFKGLIGIDEYARFALKFLGKEMTETNAKLLKDAIIANWEPPNPEVVAIIRKIHAGFRKMILSNSTPELEAEAAKEQYFQLFNPEDRIFSHRIHAMKPSEEAFDAVYRACGIGPARWVFIDDRAHNLEGARKYGVGQLILHKSAAETEKELQTLGIIG